MKPSSSTAKGRRFQRVIAAILRERFDLPEADCRPAVGSENGCDIKLSAAARLVFPFAVECKKVEAINIWSALAQAEANATAEGLAPVLVFSRNRSKAYAVVPLSCFVDLVAEVYGGPEVEVGYAVAGGVPDEGAEA